MLFQVKSSSTRILVSIIFAVIVSSCGVRIKQQYYDDDYQTTVLPTSDKILCTNENGERIDGWLIARHDSIFLVLQLQYSRSNHRRFYMPQGDYLSVEFSDGEYYHLINGWGTRSWRGNVLGDDDRITNAFIPLSDNDMSKLLSKTIVALNVQTSASNTRFIVKPKKDLALKK